MPSLDHEGLLRLFRNRPALAVELLGRNGMAVPPLAPSVEEADFTQLTPTEYRADLVLAVGSDLRIIVEIQLGRDADKRFSWPVYVTALRAKARCPVLLLVVALTPEVARWARAPIELGPPDSRLCPIVIGPDAVPPIDDAEVARSAPEFAVLSALAHARGERAVGTAHAALVAADGLDPDRGRIYADLVLHALGEAERAALEELMASEQYEYKSDFARKYVSEGRAEGRAEGRTEGLAQGRAEGVLALLGSRGLRIDDAERDRILATKDLELLARWLARAAEVEAVGELFD